MCLLGTCSLAASFSAWKKHNFVDVGTELKPAQLNAYRWHDYTGTKKIGRLYKPLNWDTFTNPVENYLWKNHNTSASGLITLIWGPLSILEWRFIKVYQLFASLIQYRGRLLCTCILEITALLSGCEHCLIYVGVENYIDYPGECEHRSRAKLLNVG